MESLNFLVLMLAAICIETNFQKKSSLEALSDLECFKLNSCFYEKRAFAQRNCELKYDVGKITDTRTIRRYNLFTKCWEIKVPAEKKAIVEVTKLTLDRTQYSDVYLKIGEHTLRPQSSNFKALFMKDTIVTFRVENIRNSNPITASFELNYKVQSLACDDPHPFKCNETDCVPMSQRCDGAKDCANGADEEGCEFSTSSKVESSSISVHSTSSKVQSSPVPVYSTSSKVRSSPIPVYSTSSQVRSSPVPVYSTSSKVESSTQIISTTEKGVSKSGQNANESLKESLEKALKLLLEKQVWTGGWGEKTPEALTAIHLANDTNFDKDSCNDRLMQKDLELQIALKWVQSDESAADVASGEELANYVIALTATCSSPKDFYKNDLVEILRKKAFPSEQTNNNQEKGRMYLALCIGESNINDALIEGAHGLLKGSYDEKYFGVLTIHCMSRRGATSAELNNKLQNAVKEIRPTINALIKAQKMDGSFSNEAALTAKIVQAWKASNMIGSGQTYIKYQKAIEYLVKEIEKSPTDYDTLLYTLPVLGDRTLADVKCHDMNRKAREEVEMTSLKKLIHGNQMSEQKTIMKVMLRKKNKF